MSFKVGDLVKLKSGGPVMVVDTIANECMISARWFIPTSYQNHSSWFPVEVLEPAGHPDPEWQAISRQTGEQEPDERVN